MTTEPLHMTVPQAGARYFGVCPDVAYALAAEGKIPAIKAGRKLVVPVAAMERRYQQLQDEALEAGQKAA